MLTFGRARLTKFIHTQAPQKKLFCKGNDLYLMEYYLHNNKYISWIVDD